jgi:hypothetical protein
MSTVKKLIVTIAGEQEERVNRYAEIIQTQVRTAFDQMSKIQQGSAYRNGSLPPLTLDVCVLQGLPANVGIAYGLDLIPSPGDSPACAVPLTDDPTLYFNRLVSHPCKFCQGKGVVQGLDLSPARIPPTEKKSYGPWPLRLTCIFLLATTLFAVFQNAHLVKQFQETTQDYIVGHQQMLRTVRDHGAALRCVAWGK